MSAIQASNLLIALDPNVLIAAALDHTHSQCLLEELWENRQFTKIALDTSGHILETFIQILPELDDQGQTFLSRLFDMLPEYTTELDVTPETSSIHALCPELAVDDQLISVEGELLAIGGQQGSQARVVVVDMQFTSSHSHECMRSRSIDDPAKVQGLCGRFPALVILTTLDARRKLADFVCNAPVYPSTERELAELLRDCDYCENETLDFKQPFNEEDDEGSYLTNGIIEAAMKCLCGFANRHGGKVIIGIAEDTRTHKGRIKGFEPHFQGRDGGTIAATDPDVILRDKLPHFLGSFSPPFEDGSVRMSIITLTTGRLVVVLQVSKQKRSPYRKFKGKAYVRIGTMDESVPQPTSGINRANHSDTLLLLNFSSPLTPDLHAGIENQSGTLLERVVDVPAVFDDQQPLVPQVRELVERIKLEPDQWRFTPLLVLLPWQQFDALLLTELYGRMGYFPTVVRILNTAKSDAEDRDTVELIDLHLQCAEAWVSSPTKCE